MCEIYAKNLIASQSIFLFRTESPIQLLERVKRVHQEWIKPGHRTGNNSHNVSATISIREHEWDAVGEWMWEREESSIVHELLPWSCRYRGGVVLS